MDNITINSVLSSYYKKTCLIIYLGIGYSEEVLATSGYSGNKYAADMLDTKDNHRDTIIKPLIEMGYKVDKALVTKKHERYEEYLGIYNAIKLQYDDLTEEEELLLWNYYLKIKTTGASGLGRVSAGGRLLKFRQPLPDYDLYIFIRTDVELKTSIKDINIDYTKINYLWPETDTTYFTSRKDFDEMTTELYGTNDPKVFWNSYNRVNGISFGVVPKKYVNVYMNYLWYDHMALHMMIRDLSPLITLENDIHMICGTDTCYVSDTKVCDNPIFTYRKTFI